MDPSSLTESEIENFLAHIAQYQLAHGSMIIAPSITEALGCPIPVARPIGVSVSPTPFPSELFNHALNIQKSMNELYVKVATDPSWLREVLVELREHDDFVLKLWSIWEKVTNEGEAQELECGIWRSDYMLHASRTDPVQRNFNSPGADRSEEETTGSGREKSPLDLHAQLKQVEFNTYSCAGGAHGNIAADMHVYLEARGLHPRSTPIRLNALPPNKTIDGIVRALEAAHAAYKPPTQNSRTAVLMTVQPRNSNTCDERPIEYGLWRCDPPVPLFRAEFSEQVLQHCRLGSDRELLYQPPWASEAVEISVVYQRAAYDAEEYDENGMRARLLLERSRAIKCPSILGHLAGLKKVQQALAEPGALERFVGPEAAGQIRPTFMRLHAMGNNTGEGLDGKELATHEESAEGYILKPSLDGGGHNIYGADIPEFLSRTPWEKWGNYILMEKITPPEMSNMLITYQDMYYGPVVSELGVFGSCLWRRQRGDREPAMLSNEQVGWSFKTKPVEIDEMSVVKGYGCFDCPRLV